MKRYIKLGLSSLLSAALLCLFVSCDSNREPYVLQKIPLQVHGNKPLEIKIDSLSGDGLNDVGIRCSAEFWDTVSATSSVKVSLKSSSGRNVVICDVFPLGKPTGLMVYITNVHYLFAIRGERASDATVEVVFTNAPAEPSQVEIIVAKTVTDTL